MTTPSERKRGEPMYTVDHNPHNSLARQGPKGQDVPWKCTYCGAVGTLNDLRTGDPPCTYEYPPCSYCGLTPICAWDCKGIGAIIVDPSVYLAGGSHDDASS